MSVRVVLFDLGNVLVRVEPDRFIAQLAHDAKRTTADVRRAVSDPGLLEQFELGRLSPHEVFEQYSSRLGRPWTFEQFTAAWNAMLSEHPDTPILLERLRPRYRLAVLSNTNILHDEHIRRTWPAFAQVHHWFVSYRMGLRKPEPNIFHAVVRETNVEPQDIVYVDDVPEHIESAGRLGIRGIHFTPGLHLDQELAAAGVHV